MIQFNLLPDVKIQYLKAKRQKHMVMLLSTVATAVSVLAILLLVGIAFVLQRKNINDLSTDIQTDTQQLKSTSNLDRMLTVQNRIISLPKLHDGKPVTTRLFTYLSQVTPNSASIANTTIDFDKHTLQLTGTADSLSTVNSFVDSLKFATFHTSAAPKSISPAFTGVVLSSFGHNQGSDKSGTTSYTINLVFSPVLFDGKSNVTLAVPSITTRGNSADLTSLFKNLTSGQQQ